MFKWYYMAEIGDSLHLIIVALLFTIVILVFSIVLVRIIRRKMRIRNASREIALLKMDLLSKQAHLENLIEDSVEWTQKDLRDYDDTMENTRVLKGKLDKGMVIADARTKKLELMNETVDLFETLQKIRTYESKMESGSDRRN
jgi:hypothetical protein